MKRLTKKDEFGNVELIGFEDMYRLECNLYPHEERSLYACLNKLADYEAEDERREHGCEYCTGKKVLFCGETIEEDSRGRPFRVREFTQFRFCPMCGKRLEAGE